MSIFNIYLWCGKISDRWSYVLFGGYQSFFISCFCKRTWNTWVVNTLRTKVGIDESDVVIHVFNSSTQYAEAGGTPRVQASLFYKVNFRTV